jgi:hypothetical protein
MIVLAFTAPQIALALCALLLFGLIVIPSFDD